MESHKTEFRGRTFIENPQYQMLERYPTGISKNKVFCITVEKCIEIPRDQPPTNKKSKQPEIKKVIRIVRWRAINDKENKNVKYWRILRPYNIRSVQEWENVQGYVNSLISPDLSDSSHVTIPTHDYEELVGEKNAKSKLENEIKKLKTEERSLQIESSLFKRRVEIMKTNKRRYEVILEKFKELIDNPITTETTIHNFIRHEKPFWLFGLEYTSIDSHVKFPPNTTDYEFDLMLKRYDNFFDLVELKGPNEQLFSKVTTRRNKPLQNLTIALGQVFTYLHICDKDTTMKNLLKPKALIVIGKDETDDMKERRIFSSFLNKVEIITYSDLLKRGEKLFEYIDTL